MQGQGRGRRGPSRALCAWRAEGDAALLSQTAELPFHQISDVDVGAERGLPVPVHPCAGGLCRRRGRPPRTAAPPPPLTAHRPAPAGGWRPYQLNAWPTPFHPLHRRGDAPDHRHRGAALYAGRDDGAAGVRAAARCGRAHSGLLCLFRAGEPDAGRGRGRADGPGRGVGFRRKHPRGDRGATKRLDYALLLPADLRPTRPSLP